MGSSMVRPIGKFMWCAGSQVFGSLWIRILYIFRRGTHVHAVTVMFTVVWVTLMYMHGWYKFLINIFIPMGVRQ